MFFRRINQNTINCIITQQDLADYGIAPDDLFERREEGLLFLRKIIEQAEKQEKMHFHGEMTSMRLAVLPDHSLSLTLSDRGGSPDRTSGGRASTDQNIAAADSSQTQTEGGQHDAETAGIQQSSDEFVFSFSGIRALLQCCGYLADFVDLTTSLYQGREKQQYYLVLTRDQMEEEQFHRIALSVNEFGELLTGKAAFLAHLKEHSKCLIRQNAALTLSKL